MDTQSLQSSHNPAAHLVEYQWKPGQSGNPSGVPGGRPKGLVKLMRAALDEGKGAKIIDKMVEKAEEGDARAAELLLNYTEGKPLQANLNLNINESVQSLGDEEFEEFVARERERRASVPRIQVEQIEGAAPRPATIALRAPSDSK